MATNDKCLVKLSEKSGRNHAHKASLQAPPCSQTDLNQSIVSLVEKALATRQGHFINQARLLKPDTNINLATLDDISAIGHLQLGLEKLDDKALAYIAKHLPRFIYGRETLFELLALKLEKVISLINDTDNGVATNTTQSSLVHESFKALTRKANAEFNAQFLAPFEAQIASNWHKELTKITHQKLPQTGSEKCYREKRACHTIHHTTKSVASSLIAETLRKIELDAIRNLHSSTECKVQPTL